MLIRMKEEHTRSQIQNRFGITIIAVGNMKEK
jgi:hypothetical protein